MTDPLATNTLVNQLRPAVNSLKANRLPGLAELAAEAADAIDRLTAERDRLLAENETLRNAQKACDTCDGSTMAEVRRLREALESALHCVETLRNDYRMHPDSDELIARLTNPARAALKDEP